MDQKLRQDTTADEKRKRHQKELTQKINEEALRRIKMGSDFKEKVCKFSTTHVGQTVIHHVLQTVIHHVVKQLSFTMCWPRANFFQVKVKKAPVSYKSPGQLPRESEVKQLKVYG